MDHETDATHRAGTTHRDRRSFPHPPVVHRLAVLSLAASVLGCLGTLAFALVLPDATDPLLFTGSLACFASCLWMSVAALRVSRDTVEADEEGLRLLSPGAPAVVLPWTEIAEVRFEQVMQRLVVRDASGARRIHMEFHLERFGELRDLVLARTRGN